MYKFSMEILRRNVFLIIGIIALLYFLGITIFLGYLNLYNCIWIFIGIVFFVFHTQKERIKIIFKKLPKIIRKIIFVCISLFVLSFFLAEILIINHSRNKNVENVHCFILLGAGLNDSKPSLILLHRINIAIKYLKQYNNAKIVVSGGKGRDETSAEAEIMAKILQDNGIEQERIIIEDKSTNTYENLLYSGRLIDINKKIVIISSWFHLFRAKCIANNLGYKDIGGIGSKSSIFLLPNYYVREYFAVIKEILAGNI